ncbi:uncharacterized protein LOC120084645 [Benincasa hispida]|uniref:uncharacterized protein LOC120084645 n=1 Tax=Benincasa hispida TaxID=102211 RepID=UPI0019029D17|nr:uncharacterized protein LOC120084645 [Benincasa hispida]
MVILLLYVDDMIITGDDPRGIFDLQVYLDEHFEMKDLGSLSYFLGCEVSSRSNGYYLSQAKYAYDFLARSGITDFTFNTTGSMFGTVGHRLKFSSQSSLILFGYFDANWTGHPTDHRSTIDVTSELLWLRWLLADMGVPQHSTTVVHCENCSAIQIAHNDVKDDKEEEDDEDGVEGAKSMQSVTSGSLHIMIYRYDMHT